MVELRGISKYFPSNGVMALENANLTLCPGEIHALLGENGSGKSTLMHIMAGYFPPSSGSVFVEGKERRFSAAAGALALGIGMLRQHPGFVNGFKVWEDCILGAEKQKPSKNKPFRSLFLNPELSRNRVEELSEHWSFDLPLDAQAESLTVSQRLKAAILSLLLRDVNWFIFDEPTAVLTSDESKTLYELFYRLRSEGKGIILITHKLNEALNVSDRVTIMKRGVTGESRNTGELSIEELRTLVFDNVTQHHILNSSLPTPNSHLLIPALEIKNLKVEAPGFPHLRNVNLRLMPGTVLGIAGVRDSGLETLELAITGLLDTSQKSDGKREGSIILNGRDITAGGVRAFRNAGGAYLGADRLGGSLARDLPLSESLIIHAFRRARFGIFLNAAMLNSLTKNIMNRAGIARSVSDRANSFSGGMIQRVLLAREFAGEPSLLVLSEPGSSLDEANLEKLAEELKAFARRGFSALLFSSDSDELNLMADEILTLRNGTLTGKGWGNEI